MKKTSEYNAFISKRKSVAFGSNYTAERVSKNHIIDNYVLQRSLVAYHVASSLVDGNVLEIGTGMGYGIEIIAPHTTHFTSIDKHVPPIDLSGLQNVTLKKLKVPRLKGIASETYDFVICFQVIEHIENDELLIQEIERVLKPGGTFIVSTPNKLKSLTRNPYHIREYTAATLKQVMSGYFHKIKMNGVFGNDRVNKYYNENRKRIYKITKWDILDLQYLVPSLILKIPYNLLNRLNRSKLYASNKDLVSSFSVDDFSIQEADEDCLDFIFTGKKFNYSS